MLKKVNIFSTISWLLRSTEIILNIIKDSLIIYQLVVKITLILYKVVVKITSILYRLVVK